MKNVTVWRRDVRNNLRLIHRFDDINDLFNLFDSNNSIHKFGEDLDRDRFKGHPEHWDRYWNQHSVFELTLERFTVYVAFDQHEKVISKKKLLELHLNYRQTREDIWYEKYVKTQPQPGRKRKGRKSKRPHLYERKPKNLHIKNDYKE